MSKLSVVALSAMSVLPSDLPTEIQINKEPKSTQINEVKNQTSDDMCFLFLENSSNSDDWTNIELSDSSNTSPEAVSLRIESISTIHIVNWIMKYFDNEVKNYELDEKSKKKVKQQLSTYFSKHPIFKTQNWKLLITISDKDLPDFFVFCNNLIDIFADNLVWYKKLVVDTFWIRKMMKNNVNNFQKELPKASKTDILDIAYDIWVALKYIEKETSDTLYLSEYYKSANRLAKNPHLQKYTDDYIKLHPNATIKDLPDTSKK